MPLPLVTKEQITDFIPQKHPIVMIDTLDFCEGLVTKTSFKVEGNNMFVKDGLLHEPGIIENIAQSAAVKAGYEVKKMGKEPLIGFIGAVKDLKIFFLPKINDRINTTVTITNEFMDVTIIKAESFVAENKVAECEMKIFIQKAPNG